MDISNNYSKLKVNLTSNENKIKELQKYKNEDFKKREVAQDFASLFTQMVLKELRKSLHEESNPLYGGLKEDVFKDMLFEEYSKSITKEGLKPLVDLIYSYSSSHSSGI